MADISYTRTFTHADWIDGESIVQAGGEDGFNGRFHACEQEFDDISATFAQVNTTVKGLQQLQFVAMQPAITLAPGTASATIPVESYDVQAQPPNLDKVYFCIVQPQQGFNVMHTFIYVTQLTKRQVALSFFNPTNQAVTFSFKVLALAVQA